MPVSYLESFPSQLCYFELMVASGVEVVEVGECSLVFVEVLPMVVPPVVKTQDYPFFSRPEVNISLHLTIKDASRNPFITQSM